MFTAIQKSRAKKGFTLVELIVVISIIAILMLILVPSLLAYLKKSKVTKAEANAKTCYNAIVAVFTDEYANGNTSITGPGLVSTAKSNGMIDSTWNVGVQMSGNAVYYVTWGVDGATGTDAQIADGDWAQWPAA